MTNALGRTCLLESDSTSEFRTEGVRKSEIRGEPTSARTRTKKPTDAYYGHNDRTLNPKKSLPSTYRS